MGCLWSQSSNYQGGHTVLSDTTVTDRTSAGGSHAHVDPRAAAAEAAERRLQQARRKGVNESNPKRGKLAEQLAKQNRGVPEPQLPERIIYD